jgi:hypothetical protein
MTFMTTNRASVRIWRRAKHLPGRLLGGLSVVVVALATLAIFSAPATADPINDSKHGCALIGPAVSGFQGAACADITPHGVAIPPSVGGFASGEAFCRRTSDLVSVECSGCRSTGRYGTTPRARWHT